jgi:hypothetical protein
VTVPEDLDEGGNPNAVPERNAVNDSVSAVNRGEAIHNEGFRACLLIEEVLPLAHEQQDYKSKQYRQHHLQGRVEPVLCSTRRA